MKKVVCVILIMLNLCFASCSGSSDVKKIIILSPVPNAVVSLANEEISRLCENYMTGDGYGYINKASGDRYYPDPLVFEWQGADDREYTLVLSKKADLSDAKEHVVRGRKISVSDLFCGTTYYYKIKETNGTGESETLSFSTKNQPRTVKIDGISNTRDIGGYETETGRIRQGLAYRGATPDSITSEGREWFKNAGIRTIIDLRESSSRKRNLYDLGVNYVELPQKGCACYIEGDMGVKVPEYRDGLIVAVKAFAVRENYPIYFHCQIGRDRTGTLAYILNCLCGVDPYILTLDYELSCFSASGCVDYDDKELQAYNMRGAMDSMHSYFLRYSKYKGNEEASVRDGIENFLLDNGVTEAEISEIRKIMTEERK